MAKPQPLALDPAREPWERQPGETERSYAHFALYRDLGRIRTLAQAAETLALNPSYLRGVAAAAQWADRAAAWDREQDRLFGERAAVQRRDMATRHAKLATAFLAKVAARLRDLEPADLTPADLAKWTDMATKLERAAYGEPTATVAVTGPAGGPLEVYDYSSLTAEQREARLTALRDELTRRIAAAGGLREDE